MEDQKPPGRGFGRGFGRGGRGVARKSSFARSFFNSGEANGEEAQLDDAVPVPASRPMGRMASRRNLSIAKRPSVRSAPSQRGIEGSRSGDSVLSSAAASLSSSRQGSLAPPIPVAAAPPRNEQENWLRQSMLRSSRTSGASGAGMGFDTNAIEAALREEEALEAGFDDEEVLEQYRIMAQHEATLRVKANTGFDMEDYEKRRKVHGNETKDKKELYGGGKKPKLGLPPPQPVISSTDNHHNSHGSLTTPPLAALAERASGATSDNYLLFLHAQQRKASALPELSRGEPVRAAEAEDGEHVVRCWGCRSSLRVNYIATLVQCPECNTVSQARKR